MFPVNERWQAPDSVGEQIDLSRETSEQARRLLQESPEQALKLLDSSIAALKGALRLLDASRAPGVEEALIFSIGTHRIAVAKEPIK